uniref:Uncharacterized protein n=1 Tax=Romanomermis culicivorax TaxID=13658 RepID=A0A915KSS9_ROMCU
MVWREFLTLQFRSFVEIVREYDIFAIGPKRFVLFAGFMEGCNNETICIQANQERKMLRKKPEPEFSTYGRRPATH